MSIQYFKLIRPAHGTECDFTDLCKQIKENPGKTFAVCLSDIRYVENISPSEGWAIHLNILHKLELGPTDDSIKIGDKVCYPWSPKDVQYPLYYLPGEDAWRLYGQNGETSHMEWGNVYPLLDITDKVDPNEDPVRNPDIYCSYRHD